MDYKKNNDGFLFENLTIPLLLFTTLSVKLTIRRTPEKLYQARGVYYLHFSKLFLL